MTMTTVGAPPAAVLPPVPADLAARGIGLRTETEQDEDFLHQLYISVRWEELAPSGWPDDAKIAFLHQQAGLQDRYYKTHYGGSAWGIITDGGTAVGRLYLHQGSADLRIIDISMLPSHRGQGIGSGLIQAVFALGAAAGTGVSIHVEMFNHGARRLYDRLGFVPTGKSDSVYQRMDWLPTAC